MLTKLQRRDFCKLRDIERKEKSQETMQNPVPSNCAVYNCKNCRNPFIGKKADRKRNWARFCSKSCKASNQGSNTDNSTQHFNIFYDDDEMRNKY